MLEVLFTGWVVLVGAILVNLLAEVLGLVTWYGFLRRARREKSLFVVPWWNLLWLVLVYPFLLGLFAWLVLG